MMPASASASQSIELKPGWNQISSPIAEGIDISTIESSCTILQYKNQKLWAWNADAQIWTNPAKVEPLKGYWVYAAYVCTVPLSGTPATFSSIQLYKGWNKVSASGALSAISGTCAGHMVGNWIWNWDKATDSWIHPTEMQPDKGYWIKVDTDCAINSSTLPNPRFVALQLPYLINIGFSRKEIMLMYVILIMQRCIPVRMLLKLYSGP